MDTNWLTAEQAVRVLIENDLEVKEPYGYAFHLGGTVLSQLERCLETCETLLEKSRYRDEPAMRQARRRMEHAEFVQKRAKRYAADLRQEIYLASLGRKSLLELRPHPWKGRQMTRVSRLSLIDWAFVTQQVDIDGFHARREGRGVPIEPRYTDELSTGQIARTVRSFTADPKEVWRELVESDKRHQLFLANLCLLHTLLQIKYPNWITEINRQGITSATELYKKEVIEKKSIAVAIASEARSSQRSIEMKIDRLLNHFLEKRSEPSIFTPGGFTAANQMLYGLVFAVANAAKATPDDKFRERMRVNHKLAWQVISDLAPSNVGGALRTLETSLIEAWKPENRTPKKATT